MNGNVVPFQLEPTSPVSEPAVDREVTFENFWLLYPRKVGRKPAFDIWLRMDEFQQRAAIIAIASWRKIFLRSDPEFIPHARTWLYGERWEDELPVDVTVSAASHQPFPVDKPLPCKTELPEAVKILLRKLTGRT